MLYSFAFFVLLLSPSQSFANLACTTKQAGREVMASDAAEIRDYRGLTLAACAQMCRNNNACVTFAYEKDPESPNVPSECGLFRTSNLALRNYPDSDVYTLDRSCLGNSGSETGQPSATEPHTTTPTAVPSCTTLIAGQQAIATTDAMEIAKTFGVSLEDCADQCKGNPTCQSFEYEFDPETQRSECESFSTTDLTLSNYPEADIFVVDRSCLGEDEAINREPEDAINECLIKQSGKRVKGKNRILLFEVSGVTMDMCRDLCKCNSDCKSFAYEFDPLESVEISECELFTSTELRLRDYEDSDVYVLNASCMEASSTSDVCNTILDFDSIRYCSVPGNGLSAFEAPKTSVVEANSQHRIGFATRGITLDACANLCLRADNCDAFFYRMTLQRCALFTTQVDGNRQEYIASQNANNRMYSRIRCGDAGCEYNTAMSTRNFNWEDKYGPRINNVDVDGCSAACDSAEDCVSFVHRARNNRCWLFDEAPETRTRSGYTTSTRTGRCV
eukprot:m.150084 g.150084  ORF g.150084 m.150084 type:complete len:504 (+) comp15021_c0_seq3:471-1982(+)